MTTHKNTQLPWDDLKIAFGLDTPDVYDMFFVSDGLTDLTQWGHRLPRGWSIDCLDTTGARSVLVFRVETMPTKRHGEQVRRLLDHMQEHLRKAANANRSKIACPNCGNDDPDLIESNDCSPKHHDYTLLCVAPVDPKDWAFDHVAPEPDQIDANGKTKCGMQWCPNSEGTDS